MRRCLNCMREYQEKYKNICPFCGYQEGDGATEEMNLIPGTILQGRYILGTIIWFRDGDMIYNGWDALFDRRVIIQEYFPCRWATRVSGQQVVVPDSGREQYEKGLELFCRQSRELLRLWREPDVVTYIACFQENQTAYGVMEYENLPTLGEWKEENLPDGKELAELLRKGIDAVERCRDIGVCHGSIDCDSFWVRADGTLVLKDFGAWCYVSGEPEETEEQELGEELDVYGLARTFFELMAVRQLGEEQLEYDFLRVPLQADRKTARALRRVLLRKVESLEQFRRELDGRGKKKRGRKDGRKADENNRGFPWWSYWAAAAVTAAICFGVQAVTGGW